MKNGKVIDDPEEEVYRRLKKKANEEIEMMHKEFIRMETDKGCSKEEAEADWDKLSSVITGDESYQNIQFHKKGGISMCDVAQNLINKGEGLGAKKQRQEDEAEIAEKDAIIAKKEDELKAAKEALNNEKNRIHDQFIQRQNEKGLSKEEAEAEYSLTFPDDKMK